MEALREDAVPVSLQVSRSIIVKFRGRRCAQVKSSQQVGTERCGGGWASSLPLCSPQEYLYKTADGLPFWIGLTKAGTNGDWYWVDETPFNMEQSRR